MIKDKKRKNNILKVVEANEGGRGEGGSQEEKKKIKNYMRKEVRR